MKRMIFIVITLVVLTLIACHTVTAACTVCTKDCRPSNPGSTTCYWWECEQTSSETTWIFKGTSCTCPSKKKSELEISVEPAAERCDGGFGNWQSQTF